MTEGREAALEGTDQYRGVKRYALGMILETKKSEASRQGPSTRVRKTKNCDLSEADLMPHPRPVLRRSYALFPVGFQFGLASLAVFITVQSTYHEGNLL